MKPVFVDSAGWMMLADGADPNHRKACSFRDGWITGAGIFVSTNFIMDETLTLIRVRLGLKAAARWWEQVDASTRLVWESIDSGREEKARGWFFRWRDKDFSFTDCTSFVVMRELGIRRALTSDRHFARAGFEMVP